MGIIYCAFFYAISLFINKLLEDEIIETNEMFKIDWIMGLWYATYLDGINDLYFIFLLLGT